MTESASAIGSTANALRPIERRVLALQAQGLPIADIARRFRRGEAHVQRIIDWTNIPRRVRPPRPGLRPVERRVLSLRAQGLSHDEIGARFRRDANYAQRIEDMAQMRTNLGLIS